MGRQGAVELGYAVAGADFRLQRTSAAFADILGDFPAGTALELILPAFSGMEETLAAVAKAEIPCWHLRSVTYFRPDETTPSYIELSVLPHLRSGGVFVVVRDVSKEVEIERAMIQRRNELRLLQQTLDTHSQALDETSKRMEAFDQERSLFLSLVTTQLRTPLATLIGYTDWLLNESDDDLTHEQQDALSIILANGRHAQGLVDDLLSADRVQSGFYHMVMDETDINALLELAVNTCRRQATEQQVSIEFRPGELPAIFGVAPLLQEALFHLVTNAIHYNHAGGQVKIATRQADDGILVQVYDTGIGIPADQQARIFQPFQRGLNMTVSTRRRLGLGLFHVRMIAEAHGGRVWLESRPDEGSTFFFWIPLKSPLQKGH